MKRFLVPLATIVLLQACSGGSSNNSQVLDVINARLADSSNLQCLDLNDNFVDIKSDPAGTFDRRPWYTILQRDGYVALRPTKADDNYDSYETGSNVGFRSNPDAYKTWVFTTKGQQQFPESKLNPGSRTICIGSPRATSIVSDVSANNSNEASLRSVTVAEDFAYARWVTETDKADIAEFYKTHANYPPSGGLTHTSSTQQKISVDEPSGAAPRVLQ